MNTNAGIKVSVIIPVYNMAKWIGNAIEKVENQTLKELEIICIDDGSTDDTFQILQQYKRKYTNVQVIHQKNAGSGPARNVGIKRANGEYVAFLDADDYYYSEDALEYLYTKAKEKNVMICRGSSCDDREGVISYNNLRPERTFSEDQMLSSEDFPGPTGMWAGIYQRKFLIDNHVLFPDLFRGQDAVFSIQAIAAAGQVYCLKKVVYVYRKEHKAVIYTDRKAFDAVYTMYEVLKISSEKGMNRIYSAWKTELLGEQGAILYKFAANGNKDMLELARKLNQLIGGGLYEGDEIRQYVNKVREDKQIFLEQLKTLDAVYVFGAGNVGKKVANYLEKNEITPTAVIVSNPSNNPECIDNIPVRSIDAIQTNKSYEVIIATFWYSQDAITQTLRERGITHILPLDLCAFLLWQDEIIH